jgi:chromosome segregation ATPase
MARAGITKHQVEKAYQSLMTQGIHPSIDALRVELGNTGSKTTISRYLKEFEAAQCVQMEDEALLSVGIKDLIAKLASKLHQEANEVVLQSKNGYQDRIKALEQDNIQLKQALESKELELEESRVDGQSLNSTNEMLNSKLSDLTNSLTQSNGKTHELEMVIMEKDKQIQSLNENHQHTRDSLVHYRDSVKEQREQELRQHEQQIQQLQLELRQLNQTLIVKQGDITELNKDNSRLVSELGNLQNQLIVAKNKHGLVSSELEELRVARESEKSKLALTLKELESLKISFKEFTDDKKARDKQLKINEQHINRIETELEIKNRLLEQLNIQKGTS